MNYLREWKNNGDGEPPNIEEFQSEADKKMEKKATVLDSFELKEVFDEISFDIDVIDKYAETCMGRRNVTNLASFPTTSNTDLLS